LLAANSTRLAAATQHFHDGLVDVLRPDRASTTKTTASGCRDRQLGLLGDLRSHPLASGAQPPYPPATN
jgi:hypothetical protein